MLVWVASYPRSGNRFFRHTLNLLYGQRSLRVYSDGTDHGPQAKDRLILDYASQQECMFIKTHDLPASDRYPTIYLLRDGRDSLVSYAWFHLTVDRKLDKADISPALYKRILRDLMLMRESDFGTWSDNVTAWTGRPQTTIVRFEDLVAKPEETVANALAELELELPPIPNSQVQTFDELKLEKQRLFRRGKVGSWQDEFPQELMDLFWQEHGQVMQQFRYGENDLPHLTVNRLVA
ncbi:MAG: sulfotransferase domain-containing protein [Pirellulales bacterium]